MTITPPVAAISWDEDFDWADVLIDCVRRIVRYKAAIQHVAVSAVQAAVERARKMAPPTSDMFLRLVAFLTPLVLEFFLQCLADYAQVDVPDVETQQSQTKQSDMWEAEQQRSRWNDHDKQEKQYEEPATVDSWSLDDGLGDQGKMPF